MDSGHSTIATAAGLIARTLADYGCDCAPLFERAGLSGALAADPSARYPSRKIQALWRLALKYTGDPCFGISVAERMQPADMYGLGFAWLASDTLLDAMERLIRYQRALSTAARFSLERVGDEVRLVLDAMIPGAAVAHATLDMVMAVAVRMCRLALGRDFEPLCIAMRRPPPECDERFEQFFGRRVVFGAPRNLICFDSASLQKPLPHASPELARANDRVVIEYLERFDRSRISMRARAWIIEQLPSGQPSQARLAQSLNMSVRSLQRKLLEENTSYKLLLDETRRELAKQYIREAYRPIGEITFLLGFSEVSNFTRAFRRWMGVSPNEYRHAA